MIFYYSLSEINEACKFIFENSNGKIILFEGDLGSGKTTLIKNLCYELGSIDNVLAISTLLLSPPERLSPMVFLTSFRLS